MNRVRMLLHFGVIPYLVFDGDYLPSKSSTEAERATRREESRKMGLELHRLGKISQASLELQKAVDVTPEMAGQFIEALKKLGVRYLVAPYEADAQLAYLERKGIIDGILSEDSDLLVFGAKCLLTKLDQYGDCIEINRKDFTACRDISLVGWTDAEFRCMAILSGCDYLTNINQMGLKTAYRLVRKYKTIERILQNLAFNNKHHIPTGYLELYRKANLTFLHQRVFCPTLNDIVMMTSLQGDQEPEDFTFIGSDMDQDTAIGVSRGELNPMTKKPMTVVSSTSSDTPKTPWGGMRKQSSTTFSELKGNKSIESFFKTQRTPLAELDPNSFTPSPSQQRLLQQNSTTWISSPVPATLQLPRPNESGRPSGTGLISTKVVGTTNENVQSETITHSSKRRRLCSETDKGHDSIEDAVDAASDRSRFFASSLPKHSPSTKKKKSSRRVKDTEVNIWSDDSVEDVMASMPDISNCADAKTKTSMKVFKDVDQEGPRRFLPTLVQENSLPLEDLQTSTITKESLNSNNSLSFAATSDTSIAQSVAKTLSENVKAELAALSDKFSYQPAVLESSLARSTHPRNKPQESHRPNSQEAKPPLVRQGSMTPLQRLGAGALNRSRSCNELFSKPASKISANPLSAATSSEPPRILKIPSSGISNQEEPTRLRGSEDRIIPDSENDSSDDTGVSGPESEAREREKPTLNLGRFAFTG